MQISALLVALPILFTQSIPMHPQEPAAIAQSPNNPSPQAALERLFTAASIQRQWFADSFLQQIPVPPEQLIQDFQTNLGAFQSAQKEGDGYRMTFGRGSLLALIVLNAEGQITGLLFQDIQSNAIALPDAIRQLQALPGETSLLVLAGTTEKAAWNAERSLAVGSTFKLAVLAALGQQIESGRRSWGDVVTLQAQDKSLPSGLLQSWFDGALLKVSFKGGSEPGVLNLTTWLVSKDGQTYCVSATWNNSNTVLDDERFFALYGGIIAGLE